MSFENLDDFSFGNEYGAFTPETLRTILRETTEAMEKITDKDSKEWKEKEKVRQGVVAALKAEGVEIQEPETVSVKEEAVKKEETEEKGPTKEINPAVLAGGFVEGDYGYLEDEKDLSVVPIAPTPAEISTTSSAIEPITEPEPTPAPKEPEVDPKESDMKRFLTVVPKKTIDKLFSDLRRFEKSGESDKFLIIGEELQKRYYKQVSAEKKKLKRKTADELRQTLSDLEEQEEKSSPNDEKAIWLIRAKIEAVSAVLEKKSPEAVSPSEEKETETKVQKLATKYFEEKLKNPAIDETGKTRFKTYLEKIKQGNFYTQIEIVGEEEVSVYDFFKNLADPKTIEFMEKEYADYPEVIQEVQVDAVAAQIVMEAFDRQNKSAESQAAK